MGYPPAGELPPNAAAGWISALLEMPLTLRADCPATGEGGGRPALADPRQVCEVLLEAREALAEEWRDRLKGVPETHLELMREHLAKAAGDSIGTEGDIGE